MMVGRLLVLAVMVTSAGLVGRVCAEPNVTQYDIDVDTRIDSRDPNYNYGVSTTARVIVNGSDGSIVRSVFTLPEDMWSIPPENVVSAKIWFYTWRNVTGDRTARLYPLARSFGEGTGDGTPSGDGATWDTYDGANAWTTPGGDYDANTFVDPFEDTPEPSYAGWFSWDITSLWGNTDLRSFGAILRMNDESDPGPDGMPRVALTSSDGAASDRPYVEVIYEPNYFNLTATVRRPSSGYVDYLPEPNDANDPCFPEGTEVLLTAVSIGGTGFKHWKVYDPNHPGDANYATFDSNHTITIVLNSDMVARAVFLCGSGLEPFVPMVLGLLLLTVYCRRGR